MNIERYFEQKKGITIDAARIAGAKYTAIDICKFAKKYHESEEKELLYTFIAEIKKEFANENWDYLDFIAERVINKQ